jgi:hypothetical protein
MGNSKKEMAEIARLVQQESIRAARQGFRDASMSGLCREGAIEAAIGSIQSLDLEKVIEQVRKQ